MSETASNIRNAAWETVPSFPSEVCLGAASSQPGYGSHLYSQQVEGLLGLEQLRLLQIQLMDLQREKVFKHLLVTSAVRGEGKTHVAANLALSLAAEGRRKVLIIDGDVRNPSLHLAYGIPNSCGFKDCLVGSQRSWNTIQKVKDLELYIMTAGLAACSSIAPRYVPSIQAMLQQFEPTVDLIIIDSPPLLGGVDTKLLSGIADAIVMVVASNRTPRRLIAQAQESIDNHKIIGAVLNRVSPTLACFKSYLEYGSQQSKNPIAERGDRKNLTVVEGVGPERVNETGESGAHSTRKVGSTSSHNDGHRGETSASPLPAELSGHPQQPTASNKRRAVQECVSDSANPQPVTPTEVLESSASADESKVLPLADRSGEVPSATNFNSDANTTRSELNIEDLRYKEEVAKGRTSTSISKDSRRKRPDYIMGALLITTISVALLLGWMIGRVGFRFVRGTVIFVKRTANITPQKAAVALLSAKPSSQPAAFQLAPGAPARTALAQPKLAPGGLVVYNNGKLIMRQNPAHGADGTRSGVDNQARKRGASDIEIPPNNRKIYLITEVDPEYPRAAREQRIQGPVVLDVHVDKDGRVLKLTTISGNRLLAEAATNGVQQWRFHPFYSNGQATEFDTRVTVTFRLPQFQ